MGRRAWWVAALAAFVGLVVGDIATAASIAGTFAAVPLLAAGGANARVTGLFGGLATVAAIVSGVVQHAGLLTGCVRVAGVVVGGVGAWALARQLSGSAERLAVARQVAEVAQYAVLTPVPAVVGPFALASAYVSASQEALIGGDLYGVVDSPFGLRVIVGDVRGKGLDAVALAAITLTTFRELAGSASDLVDIAKRLDSRVSPSLGEEDFVTAVIASLGEDGTVDMVNCGHPPPVVLHGGTLNTVDTGHPTAPLGLEPDPRNQQLLLNPGDRVLFYTDGLIEARARNGGFIDRDQALHGAGLAPLGSALPAIMRRLREQSGDGHRDDIALLLIEYAPAISESVSLSETTVGISEPPQTA